MSSVTGSSAWLSHGGRAPQPHPQVRLCPKVSALAACPVVRHHHGSVHSTSLETTSNRPRWAGNLTPDPGPPGGGGAPASHSHQAYVFPVLEVQSPQGQGPAAQAVPHCHSPQAKQPASSLHCRGPALVLKDGSKATHICCCSHWQLRDTRTHIVVLGSCMGLVPALQSIGKPPPALHIPQILEKSGCRELQFLTARFAPAGSTNSAPWVCSLPNTLPYSS